MADVLFPEGTGLAPLYAVPARDWIVIEDRVSITIEAQNIAPEVEKCIPNYRDLLGVCTTWRSSTWSALVAQGVNTGLFANDAASVLGHLLSDISGLAPSDPVPASVSFIITVQFQALARTAGERGTTASGLASQLAAFVSANRAADASLAELPLEGWSPIAGPISSLQAATVDIQTAWGAIDSQLDAAAGGQLKITSAGLLASNLAAAIASWQALADAAGAFVSMASHNLGLEAAP